MISLEAIMVLTVFVGTIVALILNQHRPADVFGVSLFILYILDLVSTQQVIDSAANQGLLTLLLLMLASVALEKTRLLRLLAAMVIKPSIKQSWFRLFGVTVAASAFLNNTAVVATLLAPIRNNPYHNASKLLIPLSYAAILGGTLTLIGTSTNLIVNSLLLDATGQEFGFFDFTLIGLAVMVACGLVMALCSSWLPNRPPQEKSYKSYFFDAKISPGSSLIGRTVDDNALRHLDSLFLVELVRNKQLISPVSPNEILCEGDRLVFNGDVEKVTQLEQFDGLDTFANSNGLLSENLTEVVVRPESVTVGKTLKQLGFRARFNAAVVAIKRDGERVSGKLGEVKIQAGDFLVLAVGRDFRERNNVLKNFIMVSGVEPQRQLGAKKELLAVLGFLAAVGLAAFGVLSLLKAMILLVGVYLAASVVTANELVRRFPKEIWMIVTGALVLSQALQNTSLLEYLASFFAGGDAAKWALGSLIVIYLMTWLLTELVTNNAAAALMFPIAYGVALAQDLNPSTFVMAVAFGASASFISPYGYQTNLMVYNAGRYRLGDFAKIGMPVALTYLIVSLTFILWVYPL